MKGRSRKEDALWVNKLDTGSNTISKGLKEQERKTKDERAMKQRNKMLGGGRKENKFGIHSPAGLN